MTEMYNIAERGAHVAPKAQAVLLLVDSTDFNYPIEKIETTSSKWSERNEAEETAPEPQVEDTSDQLQFKLYPNPNSGRMTLKYTLEEEQGQFTMYDVTGMLIMRERLQEGTHKVTVEPKDVSSGMYIYGITSDKEQLHQGKVVIMR